jgi:ATP-independent RNA helicase DbpA
MSVATETILPPELQKIFNDCGYQQLTPIQEQSIPLLLKGHDVIGQSKTGSGKTLAFSLPLIYKIQNQPQPASGIQALVLCPTRELSAQVAQEMRKVARTIPGFTVITLCGGQPIRPQIQSLEKSKITVAIGTPGRILDHLSRRTLNLNTIQTLILDEADRMLDLGFAEDLETILRHCPQQRQTLLFSATFPKEILDISQHYQKNPKKVFITTASSTLESGTDVSESLAFEEIPSFPPTLEQHYCILPQSEKTTALLHLLHQESPSLCIIFCNQKQTARDLIYELRNHSLVTEALEGDLEQRERDHILAIFKNHSIRILVATDVAARGLDVDGITHVINYDMPRDPDTYIHRVGRTARAGKNGKAISFVLSKETSRVPPEAYELKLKYNELQNSELHFNLEPHWRTLVIAGGKKDKLRIGDILGALTGEAGELSAEQIGKIQIFDFSEKRSII